MTVCALDFRYGREEMKAIFSEEAKVRYMLRVEGALADAQADCGIIPREAAKAIGSAVAGNSVRIERVREIEADINHDVMAMVRALTEVSGKGSSYVHYGATSNDIIDTSTALQLREAIVLIRKGIIELEEVIGKRAMEEKATVMLGRTHGQAALPITFGLKLAVFLSEIDRQLERLEECEKRVVVGKMSGAVGTGASFGPEFFRLQSEVMGKLGIGYEEASSQIVGRDRYAELVSVLSNLVTTCEKMATEVRNLQRTEIDEVEEYFDSARQVGSSTMAQKRNPVKAENICGLARIVRAFITPSLENMLLWHERDLTNSSAERIIIPHVMVLADDIVYKTADLFRTLLVKREVMRRNIENVRGIVMAERIMLRLADSYGRQEAHEIIRKIAMKAEAKDMTFRDALLSSAEVTKALSKRDIEKLLDPESYTGHSVEITERVVERISSQRSLNISMRTRR
jgi:adenylosuccinate lyase